ncbi:MAG: hypothetical protein HYZ14_01215 [Bacteroidetes bacterium]|nr:hypothetical protein [Bacteroidota bacterium]
MSIVHSFYTNFSNESAGRLILKLADGSSFNEGHTRIEFLSPENNLIAHHDVGGELNFEPVHEVELSIKSLKRKYKGWVKAIIHSTISKEKFLLSLGFDKTPDLETLVLVGE